MTKSTVLWEGIGQVNNIYTLKDSIENYTSILIEYQTNVDHSFMNIPTSSIKAQLGHSYIETMCMGDHGVHEFSLKSACAIRFLSTTTFEVHCVTTNNINWQLVPRRMFGKKYL